MILYQYFSYLTCLEEFLGGHSASKKSQVQKSPKLILGGGQAISIKSQVQKSPNPARGGAITTWDEFPSFVAFSIWKLSLVYVIKILKIMK